VREVKLQDTLTGELVRLEPRDPPRVGIYACGPTVYGRIHVGNARPFVVFMLLRRFLARAGYEPRLVINVTDVNDKIYDAAREAGASSADYAREMTAAYVADTDRLDLGRPDSEPLATETIEAIVSHIRDLIDGGHAYESGGDVYFAVRSFDGYGKLSNRPAGEMDQGEEAGSAELKRDPLDFALWKAAKEGEDR
jgi:cysteinyl-tRNA synthetase